jgi:carbon storage regulator
MLVLTRKPGEEIVIPSLNLRVRLVGIQGDKVRLGIEAPIDVAVHRKEVWERIKEFRDHEPAQEKLDVNAD